MNIKRLPLHVLIIAFSFGLSSCNSLGSNSITRNDNEVADTRFQNIIEALEKKDNEGLKKMFSPNALKEANDIDGGIEYIINFYKGKMKSKDGTVSGSAFKSNGGMKSELDYRKCDQSLPVCR